MKPLRTLWPFIIASLSLAGCGLTPQGEAIRQTIAEQGREAAAAGLENAEWYICRASPVGAVVDRYGTSETQWSAWSTLCLDRTAPVVQGVAQPPVDAE